MAAEAKAEAASVLPDGDLYWYISAAHTGRHAAQKAVNGVATVKRPAVAENERASLSRQRLFRQDGNILQIKGS